MAARKSEQINSMPRATVPCPARSESFSNCTERAACPLRSKHLDGIKLVLLTWYSPTRRVETTCSWLRVSCHMFTDKFRKRQRATEMAKWLVWALYSAKRLEKNRLPLPPTACTDSLGCGRPRPRLAALQKCGRHGLAPGAPGAPGATVCPRREVETCQLGDQKYGGGSKPCTPGEYQNRWQRDAHTHQNGAIGSAHGHMDPALGAFLRPF